MTTEIKLPLLPKWMERYTIPADVVGDACLADRMQAYARQAVEEYRARARAWLNDKEPSNDQ